MRFHLLRIKGNNVKMKTFAPRINKNIFKREMLLEKEGPINLNPQLYLYLISNKDLDVVQFYDEVINLCQSYNIEQKTVITVDNNKQSLYNLILNVNGYDIFKRSYLNENEDISKELAQKLKELLYSQIENEILVKSINKK